MAGERAQAAAARALASLGADADFGGGPLALDAGLGLLGGGGGRVGGQRGQGDRGVPGARRGLGSAPSLPTSPSCRSLSSPSPRSPARSLAPGGAPGEAPPARAPTTAARVSGAGSGGAPAPAPQGQRQPTVRLRGAQAEAAKKALALNLKLQAALRKELGGVADILQRNREVLRAAEARLSSNRCVGVTTSTDKFTWSRAVQKFIRLGAHPGENPGVHKEQEALLRRDQVPWKAGEAEALSKYVVKNHPEACDPQTAEQPLLQTVNWEKAAAFVDRTMRRNNKRDRLHFMRTAEECRLRWTHVGVFGAEADAPWTKEEDLAIIMQAEQREAREWVKIAQEVQNVSGGRRRRTPIACLRRFQATLNTNFVRWSKWTEEEDRTLHAAVKRYGARNWLMVARDLPGRSPAQCENKFKHARKMNPLASAAMLELAPQKGTPRHGNSPETREEDDALLPGDGAHRDEERVRQREQRLEQRLQQQQQQQQQRQQQHPQQHPQLETSVAADKKFSNAQPTRGGPWTPTEERRLCLAVRALMPQKKKKIKGNRNSTDTDRPPPPPRPPSGRAATASGTGGAKKRPRDTETSSSSSPSAPTSDQGPGAPQGAPWRGGASEEEGEEKEEEEEEEEIAGRRKRSREATDTVESLRGMNWSEVAGLMSHTRNEWQCRVKWFEVLDPSVNRSRIWSADEDVQLLKILEVRRVGEWRAVERDMAEWAKEQGILRRTDHSCKRRFAHLEPEVYEQHKRDTRDRREVEPRLNAPYSAYHGGKTEITFEDFRLVDESSEEAEVDDEEDDGDNDGW